MMQRFDLGQRGRAPAAGDMDYRKMEGHYPYAAVVPLLARRGATIEG